MKTRVPFLIALCVVAATLTLAAPRKSARPVRAETLAIGPDVCAQNPTAAGCVQWNTLRNNVKGGKALVASRDGTQLFVTGPGVDVAYKPADGTQQWAQTNTILDQADIALSADGSKVVATGESQYVHPTSEFPGREMKTTAYDPATGSVLWQAEYRGDDFGPQHANGIAIGGQRVFVTGGRNVPYMMVTVAYDLASGQQLWASNYDAPNEGGNRAYVDDAIDVAATADGARVFVTGLSHRPDGLWYDWATVAYDGQTGQELWVKRFASDGDAHAEPKQLKVSPSGALVYVAGYADVLIEGPTEGFSNDFVVIAYDAATGNQVWRSDFRPPPATADDIAWSLDVSPDGQSVYVAGYSEDPTANAGLNGYRILRLNALTGTQVWTGNVPLLSPTQDDRGLFGHASVRVSADSSEVYLAVSAHDDSQIDPLTAQGAIVYGALGYRASDGLLLWRTVYDSTATEDEYAQAIAPNPQGGAVFVTGLARNGPGDQRLLTIGIATAAGPGPSPGPNPNCLPDSLCPDWVARYNAENFNDRGVGAVTSPDGTRVYVTGMSTSATSGLDFATIAYEAATGAQLWTSRYNGPANGNDQPYYAGTGRQITISADGSTLFVVGLTAKASGANDYVTIAYRASDGAQLWASRYSTPDDSVGDSIALSGDGKRVYVTGYSALGPAPPPAPAASNYDFATIAYDSETGNELWVSRYEGPAQFWDIAYGLSVANVRQGDGMRREEIFVTGRSNGASAGNSDADFATVAYDGLTGAQLWVARYNGPGNDRDLAYGLATSPDGSLVCATGESAGIGTSADYATICYDALTGAQKWIARYDNGDLDEPLDVAFSPAGNRVAVTGFSGDPPVGIPLRSAATIVYDSATGAQVWLARHSETDGAAASTVAFSYDGRRLYIGGLENGNVVAIGNGGVGLSAGHSPSLAVAYDAANGDELWVTHYLGPAGDEGAFDLVVSPDDAHVYITGGGQSQAGDISTLSFTTGALLPPPAQLTKIASRKIHGGSAFDLELPGIECRSGGTTGDYELVFTFANPLTSVANASISGGTGSIKSRSIGEDPHEYVVDLTGVSNAQTLTVTLSNIYDALGNHTSTLQGEMSILLGDTTGDGVVNSADIAQTKSQSGQNVSGTNFREDVTTDGNLNSADIALVKSKSGTGLPP